MGLRTANTKLASMVGTHRQAFTRCHCQHDVPCAESGMRNLLVADVNPHRQQLHGRRGMLFGRASAAAAVSHLAKVHSVTAREHDHSPSFGGIDMHGTHRLLRRIQPTPIRITWSDAKMPVMPKCIYCL